MSGRRRQNATPYLAGEQGPKRMRQAGLGGSEPLCRQGGGRFLSKKGGGRWEVLASTSGGVEKGSSSSSLAIVHDLATVADEDVLDCGVCYRPLKPPIFQCPVGHALCSSCSEKLRHTRKCYLCRVAMPGGYLRCHAMERVVDSVLCGPCPHVPYGCDVARPLVYHAREEHILRCPHAPCYCPGEGCSFVGSVTTLVEHLAAAHGWPCTAEPSAGDLFGVDLRDGFNFLTAVRSGAKYLLLLDLENTPLVHIISAVWIRSVPAVVGSSSAPATTKTTCDLELRCRSYRSQFQIQCTSPSNYLPAPNASFHRFFFPKYRQAALHVKAVISIKSS